MKKELEKNLSLLDILTGIPFTSLGYACVSSQQIRSCHLKKIKFLYHKIPH